MNDDPLVANGHVSFESAAQHAYSQVPVFAPQWTAAQARAEMLRGRYECASHIVICETLQFRGLIRIEDLLAAPDEAALGELMDREAPSVAPGVDQEVAAWQAARHGESALAVVDDRGRFVGLIPPHRLLAVLLSEHEEDLSRMGGFGKGAVIARTAGEEPVRRRFRHRLPWLLVGLVGMLLAASFVGGFEAQIQDQIVLAFFMPGIIYLADAVGTQTETVVVRGLSLGLTMRRMVGPELRVALLIGLALGILAVPLVVWVWGETALALCVGLSVVGTCASATLAGLGVPWILDSLGFDPALGTAPLSTVIQDLLSIAIYLGIAKAVLG